MSQYLIRHVAYEGDQTEAEVVFRVLLFKLFNKVPTWALLTEAFDTPSTHGFSVDDYDHVLNRAFSRGERIYSAAYIMPAALPGAQRKHRTHLQLLRTMLDDRLPDRLAECQSMRAGYELLLQYRGIGPFLAYQLITDLNYTSVLSFSEMEFVMPGPGARSGLRKCFSDPGDYSDADLIRLVAERQDEEFANRSICFDNLWGRPLQLIDCQNLFCEVDKYARVAHPDVQGVGDRRRIKQRFQATSDPLEMWFPPKWGLNEDIYINLVSSPVRSSVPEDRRQSYPALVT